MLAHRVEKRAIGFGAGRGRKRSLRQHDSAETRRLAHSHGALFAVESGFAPPLDAIAKMRHDGLLRHRRGGGDARILRPSGKVGDDEPGLAGQWIGDVEHRAGTVGEDEAPPLAPRPGDAVGPGVEKESAGGFCRLP